jgi:hypothetical protein
MANPTITVGAPRRQARKGGLTTVADFRTEDRLLTGANVVYDALPCSLIVADVQLCYAPDVEAENKVGGGIDIAAGIVDTFAGYVGVECFVGPWDDYADRARDTFQQSQDRLVEARLAAWTEAATTTVASGDYVAVIGALEEAADANYIGLPVLQLSRADAVAAAAAFAIFPDDSYDGRLWTANGTPVLASSAYTAGKVGITGGITVLQSQIVVSEGLDITHNLNLAIAERGFNLIVDCGYRAVGTIGTP